MNRSIVSKGFVEATDEYIDYLVFMFKNSLKDVLPKTERLKVMFLPETLYVLLWRLQTATSAVSLYQNISPIANKVGEKIFDEKITIYNDPLDDSRPGARMFDDEGVMCRRFPIIEKGILKNFYYDLYFAEKLKEESTGNGFKGSIFSKPTPTLNHLFIEKGDKSFYDLIRMMDHGIIIGEALGAHSGNIPNGDFSIGVSPAIYVEKGEVVGHVKDVMVAGNIYDVMKSVIGIEDRLYPAHSGYFPSMLFDNISVTFKR
jgi:PmbA protein